MRDAIEQYLLGEFKAAPRFEAMPDGALKATISEGGCDYGAEFSRDFLEEHDPHRVTELLTEWNVAGEMRRMEGLEISVSNVGVRLDSSN